MEKEIINILKTHGCLHMADDNKELLIDLQKNCEIDFAKWCLKNVKKAPSGKKYVFKKSNQVVADEHTIGELYKVFIIDKEYNF